MCAYNIPANTLPNSKCSPVVCGDQCCSMTASAVGLKFITVMVFALDQKTF